jgi:hypothetical protein
MKKVLSQEFLKTKHSLEPPAQKKYSQDEEF